MPRSAETAPVLGKARRRPFAATPAAAWLAMVCIVAAVFAAYHNSFSGPFVFDDGPAILGNPTIRHLSDLGEVLSPPRERGQTVGGRPVVNLSLAINHALGGEDVRGYHIFNFAVHVLNALLLFGVVRRTLRLPILSAKMGASATPLAAAIAVLWAVHPLLTESVTYVIQRAESLVSLFYLLTLYCFIRGAEFSAGDDTSSRAELNNRRSTIWQALAFLACLVGMATKEVMATAPLLVLFFDRIFVADSWREVWSRRRIFHLGLASTWVLLGWLVLGTNNRGGTAGLGLDDSVWTYMLTQTRSITCYLRLAFWPDPLVFDYGTDAIDNLSAAAPFVLVVLALIAGVIVALWRWPAGGFLGVWFFGILAPSSSFVPIPVQPMAEHRMYLPLAAVVAGVVLTLYVRWRRASWFVFAGTAVVLATVTASRNSDFRSATAIWGDTVSKRPENARARCYLADGLAAEGRFDEALAQYEEALRLDRSMANRSERNIHTDILVNSANVLATLGRETEATKRYEEALGIEPNLTEAHANLGRVYLRANRLPDAVSEFEKALKLDPKNSGVHASLASALLLQRHTAKALEHYDTALRLNPSAKAHRDLGVALYYVRRFSDAIEQLKQAVRLDPESAQAHEFLGNALAAMGRDAEAIPHFKRVLELDPGNERARRALEAISATPLR